MRCAAVYGSVGSISRPDGAPVMSVPLQGLMKVCESDKEEQQDKTTPLTSIEKFSDREDKIL